MPRRKKNRETTPGDIQRSRIPRNVPDVVKGTPLQIESLGVFCWSEGRADENVPPSQVHVVLELAGDLPPLVLRLKSAGAVNTVIRMLEENRNEVWPGES